MLNKYWLWGLHTKNIHLLEYRIFAETHKKYIVNMVIRNRGDYSFKLLDSIYFNYSDIVEKWDQMLVDVIAVYGVIRWGEYSADL